MGKQDYCHIFTRLIQKTNPLSPLKKTKKNQKKLHPLFTFNCHRYEQKVKEMQTPVEIGSLISKKIQGKLSEAEKEKLNSWIASSAENKATYEKAINPAEQLAKLKNYQAYDVDKAWKNLRNKNGKIVYLQTKLVRYAAAVLIPLLISTSVFFVLKNRQPEISLATIDEQIKPGTEKATLILSDGAEVDLTAEINENKIKKDGVKIDREKKKLFYNQKEKTTVEITKLAYNQLRVPLGGTYTLTLADRTQVWLNAGSSLKYPVEFTEDTRQVYLSGEAFFDVTKTGKTFIVNAEDAAIRVLGTQFNVTAYADETKLTTTLVEGKVQIEGDSISKPEILTPDMQAVITKHANHVETRKVNTGEFTSWKDGKLEFRNQDLEQVMKRLSRWYNFEYEFENQQAKAFHFSARINNTEQISTILEMLELTTQVKFEIKGNRIIII